MKYIQIIIKLILFIPTFLILLATNTIYPIFELLYNKFKIFDIENITDEHIQNISQTFNDFTIKFKIEKAYQNKFIELLNTLSKYEKDYVQDINTKQYCYLNIRYVLAIIDQAKDAISELEKVNKDNRKASYYENTKYSSMDNLIQEYNDRLNDTTHHKITLKTSIKETRLKKLFAKLRKHNKLFFTFYLTIFTLYPLKKLKINKKDEDVFDLINDIFKFHSIGHATPKQIQKSVAIQIYNIYKYKFNNDDELKRIIGELIDYCFHTNEPYTNFNKIDHEVYIKNLVYQFPIFECDNNISFKQNKIVKRYFLGKNMLIPKYIPKFLKKTVINKFITKPIDFYYKHRLLTFFGFMQKKI